jgi:hypothetical protein
MQKITYSPVNLSSTIPTDTNKEGSSIIMLTPSSQESNNICSLPNAIWYGQIQNLSSDSNCFCPQIKLSKKLSGITYYKCDINQTLN